MKAGLILTVLILVGCILSSPIKEMFNSSSETFNSVVFTEYGSSAYSEANNIKYIDFSKALGFNTISILFTCHVDNLTSSKIDCTSNNSPKLNNVSKLIKKAHDSGLKVSLRLYIDVLSGEWRALWDPQDKENAFLEIRKTILRFAEFSKENDVDLFIIGAELEKLTRPKYTNEWLKIISSIRAVYKGKISYGANGNYSSYEVPEYKWITFWDKLDAVGIDYYTPLVLTNVNKAQLSQHHCTNLDSLQQLYKGQVIFFNEVGFPAAQNGHTKPYEWKWPKVTINDFQNQANGISAFFECLDKVNLLGVSIWRYMPGEAAVYPNGYILENSKTKKAMKKALRSL